MRGRLGLALMLIALGCAPQRAPSAIIAVIGLQNAQRVDRVEVWICNVPADTTDPWFDDLPLRLALTPRNVVERVGTGVSTYFSTISHGQYDVTFAEGATVDATAQDTTQTCARKALDQSSLSANVVLVVANAEHVGTVPGGWGSAGQSALCKRPCPARDSGRVAYVGGADFHPDSATTPRDLIEHELGHALGLPHSGNVAADKPTYDSPIDVMSNSAAGRITSPPAIDAPDTIAINRLALGWHAGNRYGGHRLYGAEWQRGLPGWRHHQDHQHQRPARCLAGRR